MECDIFAVGLILLQTELKNVCKPDILCIHGFVCLYKLLRTYWCDNSPEKTTTQPKLWWGFTKTFYSMTKENIRLYNTNTVLPNYISKRDIRNWWIFLSLQSVTFLQKCNFVHWRWPDFTVVVYKPQICQVYVPS